MVLEKRKRDNNMRYNKIRKMDISNGPGIRISLFVQGCPFHCKGCFNECTWDFNQGKHFTNETLQLLLKNAKMDYIAGLSVLGGEPLHPKNIDEVITICKKFKESYPEKDIWLWTGYLIENINNNEIFKYVDYIVDGQFIEDLKDSTLKFRGSSNQRVINIKEYLEEVNF